MKTPNETSRPQVAPETAAHDNAEPITTEASLKPLIPAWMDDLPLRPIPYRVYCHLWRRGETYSTAATIAAKCRIKRDTVFAALAELERAGLIRKKKRKGQTSLIQPVPPNGATPKGAAPPQTGRDPSPQTGRDPSPQTVLKGIPCKGIPRKVSPSLLDALWQATPPMGKERSSRKQLATALKKLPKGTTAETILEALEGWKRSESWTKDNGQFVPGIHRWFNDGKWQDVPTPSEKTNGATINFGGRAAYIDKP